MTGQDASGRLVGGRYRLGRMLGRGGMGAVWQADDTLLARRVALKEVWLPSAGDGPIDPSDPVVRRVIREAQAAARLRHPGIVTVHDVINEDGRPWIVMELVDGRSLADVIAEQGLLSERQAAEVGLQVLDALRAAHREGIAHRDVKPANILLAEDRVVLTDFGIATIYDETALTATGQLVGSPAYLAPERINGLPATAAADMWALGVTLYTAVTGESPFQRDTTPATLLAVLNHRPATPAHAGRLWPLVKGLLEKDPSRRLTVEQSRTLLTNAIRMLDAAEQGGGRVRLPFLRRNAEDTTGLPRTVVAPSPTIASPTALHTETDTAVVATPLPAYPESAGRSRRRRTTVTIGAAVVLVVALAGSLLTIYYPELTSAGLDTAASPSPSASPSTSPSPGTRPSTAAASLPGAAVTLDQCLVGTWESVNFSKKLKIRTDVFSFTGGSGMIRRIWPDGRSADDYSKAAPLTASKGADRYAETIRGTRSQQADTSGGRVTLDGIVSQLVLQITENGEQLPVTVFPRESESYPYTCSANDLALNDGATFEIYRRLGTDPDLLAPR
jgi:serine/threonine protein kinase